MHQLGISVYPDKSERKDIERYIRKASACGFTRIFTCLLSVDKPKDALIEEFRSLHDYAHSLGFTIIADVAPRVFTALGLEVGDLGFFQDLGVDGVRLDRGFTGLEESLMTFNEENLLIEINMSNDVATVDTIMDFQANPYRLWGCFNFYPHDHTGLSLDFLKACTKRFKKYGLHTAAFVTSQNTNTFGPWPVSNGLPTLEMHRHMPIDVQAKHFIALGGIDDILVSNCYASDKELEKLGKLNLEMVNFDVQIDATMPQILKDILLKEIHMNRGDITPCMIRSSRPREVYNGNDVPLWNGKKEIHRGDVLIESNLAKNYAAELQIAREDFISDGKSNVVAHLKEEELFLVDVLRPWQKFRFTID